MSYQWPFLPMLLAVISMQAFGDEQNDLLNMDESHSPSSAVTEPEIESCSVSSTVTEPEIESCSVSSNVSEVDPEVESDSVSFCCSEVQPVIEVKVGYFFFTDSKMRDIYDEGGLDVQLSGSFPIWRWLQIYGSVEYLARSGRSLGGFQNTSIWEVPLSLGLKPVFSITQGIQYYFAIGPSYVFVYGHNHSSFVDQNISQNGLGGFVNTGFNFFPCTHMLVDIFAQYSYVRMHFHPSRENVFGSSIQVGGFAFGGGLGYAF